MPLVTNYLQIIKTTSTDSKITPAVIQKDVYSNIANDKLSDLLKQGVILVDIRREDEWRKTGIVRNSKTITFFDDRGNINPNFVSTLSSIAAKDKPVILICQTGGRTRAVSAALVKQLGYQNVMNVTHGISSWIRENREVIQYNK